MITSPASVELVDLPSLFVAQRRDAHKRKPHGGTPAASFPFHPSSAFHHRVRCISNPLTTWSSGEAAAISGGECAVPRIQAAAITLSTLNWRVNRRILLVRRSFEARGISDWTVEEEEKEGRKGEEKHKEDSNGRRVFYTQKYLEQIFFFGQI